VFGLVLSILGLAVCVGAIVIGLIVMTNK
jgi:hypothetical protein